ncbi:MAG: rod shape-determining protein MreC [Oscillospiraceae bacterium]|nr:rod shape-determining protein MreC [Oscillospiraceae bacterium]
MAKFFKTAGIVILILLVLVLLLTGIGRLLGGASPLSQLMQAALSPVDKLLGSGVARLEDIYGYMHDYDQLKEENAALKAQIAEMANEVRRSQDANEENERLRTLLNLQRAHMDYAMVDANLISWSTSSWSSAFNIDRGSRDGIEAGDCVITECGYLVGIVTECGRYSSTVRTLLDPRSAVAARMEEAGITAVAAGDFALMSQGRLKLTYLQDTGVLVIGDTVLTTGSGGVYPSGLVIGTVADLRLDQGGFTEYGIMDPAVELASLRQVFVIRGYEEENDAD